MQLATGFSAVINGGKMMKPYIVREIRDPEGKTVYYGSPHELRRVLSPKTSEQMREILGSVVQEDGSGVQARVKGFIVGGKTGTSQKVEPGKKGYSPDKRVASFIGFLPLHDPQLLILVVIDEPRGSVYGGVVAAPAFNQIAVKTAYYLGIRPTEAVAAPEASQREKNRPRKMPYSPIPVPVTTVSTGASAGQMIMPDLIGLSMGRVVDLMDRYPVRMSMTGSGVARAQTPAPGAVLLDGAECSVRFAPDAAMLKSVADGGKQ
jgi:cell division protein FtsI (penicillin-binding protein 3)